MFWYLAAEVGGGQVLGLAGGQGALRVPGGDAGGQVLGPPGGEGHRAAVVVLPVDTAGVVRLSGVPGYSVMGEITFRGVYL